MLVSSALWAGLVACGGTEEAAPPPAAPALAAPGADEGAARRERRGKRADRRGGGSELTPIGELPSVSDPCAAWERPGLYTVTVPFGGRETPTLVYIPDKAGPRRMAVLLHGGSGAPSDVMDQTGILRIADQHGIVVVGPQGGGGSKDGNWNPRDAAPGARDDVRYLDLVVENLKPRTCSRQVLGMGFSNGAMMAMRWLCQGTTPDAAVTGSGRMGVPVNSCRSPRPIRSYVGTADDHYSTEHPTTPESLDMWAEVNRCNGRAREAKSGRITERAWAGCRASTQQFVIEGFPHAWPKPGAKGDAPVDATVDSWRWFADVVP